MEKYGKKELKKPLGNVRYFVSCDIVRPPVRFRIGKPTRKEVVV